MSVMRPDLIMKSIIPVVMAGIIAIYGLVVSVLIANGMNPASYTLFKYVSPAFSRLSYPTVVLYPCPVHVLTSPSILVSCSLRGFIDLGAGLAVGISGLAAGFAIGIVGDSGVRGTAQQPRVSLPAVGTCVFFLILGGLVECLARLDRFNLPIAIHAVSHPTFYACHCSSSSE